MKKTTQFKRGSEIKTPPDPTPSNRWRKHMKGINNPKKLRYLRTMSANVMYRRRLQEWGIAKKKQKRKNVEEKNYFFKK